MNNAWAILSGMPYTQHPLWLKKAPRKGSKGIGDGNDYIYVTQGNNSLGFWRYTISKDSWAILPDVPLGLDRKKVKGGTDLVYYTGDSVDYVYMLKGYRTEFFRFNVATETWEQLADAPVGARNKYDKGSFIVMDEDQKYIYAHKAKYMEMYRYDTDSMVWGPALTGMPLVGSNGRRKKSKDGGCGAWWPNHNGFYALKGGNTPDLWWYDAPDSTGGDVWTQKEDMPLEPSGKKVKHGADITQFTGVFFALKGNKQLELWRYLPASAYGYKPEREGIMGRPIKLGRVGVDVAPNPLTGGFASVRYTLPKAGPASVSVFDVAGRNVAQRTFIASRTGAVNFDVRHLSAGVYLVRFESGDYVAKKKLVIQ